MTEQKLTRQLADRTETYARDIQGKCSCGQPVIKVIGSSCSSRTDGARYTYPGYTTAWCIFRCKNCQSVITDSFIPVQQQYTNMENGPSHSCGSAYEYIMDAIRESELTKTDVAAIMDITKAKLNYHLDKLKKNDTRINVLFLQLLVIVLHIDLGELCKRIEANMTKEEKADGERIKKFVSDILAKKAKLSEKQRMAFYPNKLPKSFNTIIPDRLN